VLGKWWVENKKGLRESLRVLALQPREGLGFVVDPDHLVALIEGREVFDGAFHGGGVVVEEPEAGVARSADETAMKPRVVTVILDESRHGAQANGTLHRDYFKAIRDELLRKYGLRVHEYGSRAHAHGHGWTAGSAGQDPTPRERE
jgi:hypothetical protein